MITKENREVAVEDRNVVLLCAEAKRRGNQGVVEALNHPSLGCSFTKFSSWDSSLKSSCCPLKSVGQARFKAAANS